MNPSLNSKVTSGMAARILADALMIEIVTFGTIIIRYAWAVTVERGITVPLTSFGTFLAHYVPGSFILTTICIIVFWLCGFYTHGRAYAGRTKGLVIAQAVTLSFLVFGALAFLLRGIFAFPLSALLLSWACVLLMLLASRLWSMLWRAIVVRENALVPDKSAEVQPRQILVIGGAGYIGAALLPKLLESGYAVKVLDRFIFGRDPIAPLLGHPRLEILQGDFRHIDQVVKAVQGMDAVVHLGAIVGDPACALDEHLTIDVNLVATRMIAEVAKGSGIRRFVFASTCSVYGASDEILDECSLLNAVSLYARSKVASERVLRSMASPAFAPTILRFGTIYGLSGRTRFDLVINLLTATAVTEGRIPVHGGDQWRPFLHVDDAALSVLKVLDAPEAAVSNAVFNVGCDEQNLTIRQVGEIIQKLVPEAELIVNAADTDRRNYRVSFAAIRGAIGFRPNWTVERGVQQVIEAVRSGRIKDFRDSSYSNAKFLSESGTSRLGRSGTDWAQEYIVQTAEKGPSPAVDAGASSGPDVGPSLANRNGG